MTLTQSEVYPNAAVELNGNKGTVVSSDGSVTAIASEDGSVSLYTTAHFMENATVPEVPESQPEPGPSVSGSATIGTAPVDTVNPAAAGPENTAVNEPVAVDNAGVPAATSLGPDVNPVVQTDSEQNVDEQIAEARAKLTALEQEKSNGNPDGNRTQSN